MENEDTKDLSQQDLNKTTQDTKECDHCESAFLFQEDLLNHRKIHKSTIAQVRSAS